MALFASDFAWMGMREGPGQELFAAPRRRDVGAAVAQTEKLHAVIEMGSPLNSNFCPAWKPAIIESLPLSHRLMPFMLAFSYTVAFLCKRMYRVQHQFHFQFFSVDYQQFTLQSTKPRTGLMSHRALCHEAPPHPMDQSEYKAAKRAGERAAAIY